MKKIALAVSMILLLGSLFPAIVILDGEVRAERSSEPEIKYTLHAPIRIENDTDFANQATSEGWSGDGSSGNPYLIENYEIDAHGSGSAIYIGNTTVHFTIRSCYFYNTSDVSYPYYYGSGLTLRNVTTGVVESSRIWNNENYGVFMQYSMGVVVSGNNISYNDQRGIYLMESVNNTIENNGMYANQWYGIDLSTYSNNNSIINNTILRTASHGISLSNCNDTVISNNTIKYNSHYGSIDLSYSLGAVIKNNTMEDYDSHGGIYVSGDQMRYWNTHDIDTSNILKGKPVYYWKDRTSGSVPSDAAQVILANCSGVSVENMNISMVYEAIQLGFSDKNHIKNVSLYKDSWGVRLLYSDHNILSDSEIRNNDDGIWIDRCTENTIRNNTVADSNYYGIYMASFDTTPVVWGNSFYHNNLINNAHQLYYSSNNEIDRWNLAYPQGGNFWSNYNGNDIECGESQNISGSDGMGDSPLTIYGNQDAYPLMAAWETAPKVISSTPADGENSVALGKNISIVFSRSMNTSVIPKLHQIDGTGVVYSFSGWSSTNLENDTATWTHDDWNEKEWVGLELCNYSDTEERYGLPHIWSFKTVDLTAPHVSSTDPADGEASVSLAQDVKVVFDESLDTSVIPQFSELSSSGVSYTFAGFSSTNENNDTATWTHGSWPEKYAVELKVTGAEDSSGNVMGTAYVWNLTTADLTPPNVIGTEPYDGETGVNKSVSIVVVFSEEMNTSYNSGHPTLILENGTYGGSWTFLGWSSTNVMNDTARWSHDPFEERDRISLRVQNYADLAGNAGSPYEWTFYTEDTQAPSITKTTPEQGDSGVNENENVTITFSESMNTSAPPVITQTGGNPVNYTFSHWESVYVANDTAIWTHDPWSSEDSVTLMVSNYSDPAGNIGVNYTWSFDIRDYVGPHVLSTDPADGDVWVPLDKVVTVVFSETMSYARVYGEVGVTYTFLGWSTTYVHNDTGMWSHTNWSENMDLLISVDNLQDEAGNAGDKYQFTIHTADLTKPLVSDLTHPYNGQKNVAYGANVSVVFTESMNSSVTPTLVQNAGDMVTYTFLGWFTTDNDNDTAIWSHDDWTDSDTVNLTVSNYSDRAGNIGDAYTWEFRVEDHTAPHVVATSPPDGAINVSAHLASITVTWSEPMDSNGNPALDIVESDGARPNIVFYRWLNDTTAIFNVSGNFSESDNIELRVGTVQDPYNNDAVTYYWWIYTYDPVPPTVSDAIPLPGGAAEKNATVTVAFSEKMNESVIPQITQADGDPGSWVFLGWSTGYHNVSGEMKEVSEANWAHNNWTTDRVNLTVSGYRDICGNWGQPYSWEFNVSVYDDHSMIRINSNAEFANMALSEGWAGDGSPGNPYIIEYYEINGDDGRGGYCIYIGNTTSNFIIRHNKLNYAYTDNAVYPYYPRASVVLYNVTGGKVEDNSMLVESDFAVYTSESQNVNISGNTIHNAWWNGMNIEDSQYITIDGNELTGGGNGLYLKNSPYASIRRNILSHNGDQQGITLENSSYAVLVGNLISDYAYGIVFDPSDGTDVNITLEGNAMKNCGLMIWGWMAEHWTSHTIVNNTVNSRPLVFLNGVDDSQINYTVQAGQIYLVDCYNVSVSYQFIVRASIGLYVAMSQHITVVNSTFGYNNYGIYMVGSDSNLIWHNNFVGNDVQAHDDGGSGDNAWNETYPYSGNYWDDYGGSDNNLGPGQNYPGSDGIGDSPYSIDGGGAEDKYPLMNPTNLTLYYTPGWHMVAFPWLDSPTDITDVLSGQSWDRAMVYVNGTWHTYNANRDAKFNGDFPKIDRSMGLWVNFTDNSTLIAPSPIHTGNITVYLHPGWNLVEGGLPFLVSEVFEGVDHSHVESANLTDPSEMEHMTENDTMMPGRGYWVYVDGNYTISIDTDLFEITVQEGLIYNSHPVQDMDSDPPADVSSSTAPITDNTPDHTPFIALSVAIIGMLGTAWAIRRRR